MSMSKITHIVVHYSATYSDQDFGVKEVDAMHKARGWKGVGYHYVIRRNGKVEKGRPDSQVGAHVGGQNSGKLGICCIGGLERVTGPNKGVDTRTPAQTEALIKLIRKLKAKHPNAKVVGHRDLAATQCPGFDVRPWWAKVENEPALKPKPAPADAPVKTPGVVEGDTYTVQPGDTLWAISKTHAVSVESIAQANAIQPTSSLRIGQRLRIPPAAPTMTPALKTLLGGLAAAVAALLAYFGL